MYCLKCGNEIKDNEQLCSNCGWNKNSGSINNDNKFATTNIGVLNNSSTISKEESDERLIHQRQFQELVEIYIGSMYYNFKKGSFSWCAFFLGPFYIAYRKMLGVSLVVYGINMLISVIFAKSILLRTVVALIFDLFLGISFKKIYFENSVETVAKLKQNNPEKGINELAQIAKVKGGTSVLYPILMVILGGLIFSILVMIFNISINPADSIEEVQRILHNIQNIQNGSF